MILPINYRYAAALLLLSAVTASAHDHFAVGISDTSGNGKADPDEPLAFVGENGTDRVFHLLPRPFGISPDGAAAGYYELGDQVRTLFPLDGFSMKALSDGQYELEEPYHAMTGAWIWCEVVKVEGPPGGHFGFWEVEQPSESDVPTFTMTANQPTGNPQFILGEGIDAADEDPSGHIHYRSWTADKPGDYRVTFRLIDRSTNRPTGGPWHQPSVGYTYLFRAGPDFQPKIERLEKSIRLTWPSQMGIWDAVNQTGIVFTVLRSSSPAGLDWTPIGSVTGTTADTISFTDAEPPPGKAFYKLAYDWADQ